MASGPSLYPNATDGTRSIGHMTEWKANNIKKELHY
jgi:hypothetical protein